MAAAKSVNLNEATITKLQDSITRYYTLIDGILGASFYELYDQTDYESAFTLHQKIEADWKEAQDIYTLCKSLLKPHNKLLVDMTAMGRIIAVECITFNNDFMEKWKAYPAVKPPQSEEFKAHMGDKPRQFHELVTTYLSKLRNGSVLQIIQNSLRSLNNNSKSKNSKSKKRKIIHDPTAPHRFNEYESYTTPVQSKMEHSLARLRLHAIINGRDKEKMEQAQRNGYTLYGLQPGTYGLQYPVGVRDLRNELHRPQMPRINWEKEQNSMRQKIHKRKNGNNNRGNNGNNGNKTAKRQKTRH